MMDGYQKQIEGYRNRGNYDTRCSHNCMDYLYMSINNLKGLLADFQKKYDNDYEKIENRVTYQRMQIDKLKEQKRFLTEAIQRFHEEIEQMRQYEERLNARRLEQQMVIVDFYWTTLRHYWTIFLLLTFFITERIGVGKEEIEKESCCRRQEQRQRKRQKINVIEREW